MNDDEVVNARIDKFAHITLTENEFEALVRISGQTKEQLLAAMEAAKVAALLEDRKLSPYDASAPPHGDIVFNNE